MWPGRFARLPCPAEEEEREREREREPFWLKSLTFVGTRLSPGGPGGGLEANPCKTWLT